MMCAQEDSIPGPPQHDGEIIPLDYWSSLLISADYFITSLSKGYYSSSWVTVTDY